MQKNKNKIIIFKSIILLAVFFLSYEFSLANGCCVYDLTKNIGTNCFWNDTAANCAAHLPSPGFYTDGDINCCEAVDQPFCDTALCAGPGPGPGPGPSPVPPVTCDTGFTKVGNVCFPDSSNVNLPNPTSGASQILSNTLSWLLGIFSVIAIMAFVISGTQYLTSAGDEEQAKTAKRNATYALLGVVVGLSGFIILQAVTSALGGTSSLF